MRSVRIAAGMEAFIATAAMRRHSILRLTVMPCRPSPHDREAAKREFLRRINLSIFGGSA
jgi:hypothetical protein